MVKISDSSIVYLSEKIGLVIIELFYDRDDYMWLWKINNHVYKKIGRNSNAGDHELKIDYFLKEAANDMFRLNKYSVDCSSNLKQIQSIFGSYYFYTILNEILTEKHPEYLI